MARYPRLARDIEELSESVKHRLENLNDDLIGYRQGNRGRAKSIASELRVLVSSEGRNNKILFKIAALNKIEMMVRRDGPPVEGFKRVLTLDEALSEVVFQSGVPDYISLTGYEVIKRFADQQGSHEDETISEDLFRMKGQGLYIGGVPAVEAVLINLAEMVLSAASPLMEKLISTK